MKKTIAYLFAALAIVTAASCTKVEQQIDGEEAGNGKIITCTFAANDNTTKTTTTDGKTPLWAAGDQIKVYDAGDVSKTAVITLVAHGTEPAANEGVLSSDCKSFTYTKPSGWTGALCAIYPASAFTEFSSNDPVINFAGQDGTFGKANICAGKEDAGGIISFKNVGAILKFKEKPATVTDVFIPIEGLKDNYPISFSVTTPSLGTAITAANSKSFSVGTGTGPIYIGVPAATVAVGSIFLYTDAAKTILGSNTTANSNTLEVNKVYYLGTIATGTIPTGFLKYAFSVSATKKVYFSKGNLQYQASTSSWRFADHQYDFFGEGGGNETEESGRDTQSAWIDLFGWGTTGENVYGEQPYCASDDGTYNTEDPASNTETLTIANKADWGYCMGGATSVWYTLSGGSDREWDYLLESRPNAADKIGYATVAGVTGIIILPDSFTDPMKNEGSGAFVSKSTTGFTVNVYAAGDNWNAMEAAGAVFLPGAGYRYGPNLDDICDNGYYWSSTAYDSGCAYCLYFNSNSFEQTRFAREHGFSVRLVSAAQ